jgi:adenylate cyclase
MSPGGNLSAVRSRRRQTIWIVLLTGTFWALLAGPVRFLPWQNFEHAVQDSLQKALPTEQVAPELLFVALDEESVTLSPLLDEEIAAEPTLQLMSAEFPWSREVYARLTEKLLGAGARVVILDVSFPRPADEVGDGALAKVLQERSEQVVIASVFENDLAGNVVLSLPSETILPEGWGDGRVGYANFWPDGDGVVRSADDWQSLSGAAGREAYPGEEHVPSLGVAALRRIGVEVPAEGGGSRPLRFAAQGSFPIVPLWSIFHEDSWERNLRGGEVFRDRIVLFGPTAGRFRDFHRTPVGAAMSGPELHLQSISNLLTGERLRHLPWWVGALLSYLAALVAAWSLGWAGRPWQGLFLLTALGVGYLGVLAGALAWWDWLLPAAVPLASLGSCGLLIFARDYALERQERTRARRTLERYVSRDIVREILDSPDSYLAQLGGVRKEVVVLFSDLRGFTALTERSEPAELVEQLNEYLGRMVEAVFAQQGTVDKFIGDAVMAVWGTVVAGSPVENGQRAVQSARQMLAELTKLNRKWSEAGRPPLGLGIGLNAGEVIFGNMGSEQKMEPTVIGDAVNLASRVESLCKKYGVSLLFTESVREALGEMGELRRVDLVRVVGRSHPVELFSVASSEQVWPMAMDQAILSYRAGDFPAAQKILQDLVVEGMESGKLVEIYRQRVASALTRSTDLPWDAVHDWTEK